ATLDPLARIGSGPRIVGRATKKSQGCLPESARSERDERARGDGRSLGQMLGDHDGARRRETAGADAVEGGVAEAALVRRIEEHDGEGGALAYEAIERARDVLAENSRRDRSFARSEPATHGALSSAHTCQAELAAPALQESLAQPTVSVILELRIGGDDPLRFDARILENRGVAQEIGDPELRQARLAGPKELSGSA